MHINVVKRSSALWALAPALCPRLALWSWKGRGLIFKRGEGPPGSSLRLSYRCPGAL